MKFNTGIVLAALAMTLAGCSTGPTAVPPSVLATAPAVTAHTVEPRFVTSEFSLWDSAAFKQIAEDAAKVAPVRNWSISFTRCDSLETGNGPVFLDGQDVKNGWFVGAFKCAGATGAEHNGFAGLRSSDWGTPAHFDYVLGLEAQADAPSFEGFVLPSPTAYATLDIGFSRPGRYTVTLKPGFADPYAKETRYTLTLYVGATESWPVSVTRTTYPAAMSTKVATISDSTVKGLPVNARW
jgi:predicted small lipoprotein YifL